MPTPLEFLAIASVAVVVLCYLRIQHKKETANQIARSFCRQHKLQLLDGTVAFRGWHITRIGQPVAIRFRFEYSTNRADRHPGYISIVGNSIQNIFVNEEHTVGSTGEISKPM
jgi:hypothetical protein